jgi:hypothetical protein
MLVQTKLIKLDKILKFLNELSNAPNIPAPKTSRDMETFRRQIKSHNLFPVEIKINPFLIIGVSRLIKVKGEIFNVPESVSSSLVNNYEPEINFVLNSLVEDAFGGCETIFKVYFSTGDPCWYIDGRDYERICCLV